MRTEQLECLIEVSRHKSLNSASKVLHLTPQALSMSIKQLENELGFQVLRRSAVGATLTPQGQAMVTSALAFFNNIASIREQFKMADADFLAPEIELMMPPGSAEGYIPSFQAAVYKISPHSQLAIREATYQEIIQSVLEEKVDMAITAQLAIDSRDMLRDIPDTLRFMPFLSCRYYCYGSSHFPITRYKAMALKSMLDFPIVLYEPARYIFAKIIESVCSLEQADIIWVSNAVALSEFLKNGIGLGFGLVNERNHSFINQLPSGIAVPLKESIITQYGCLVKPNKQLPETTWNLINYLRVFFNS